MVISFLGLYRARSAGNPPENKCKFSLTRCCESCYKPCLVAVCCCLLLSVAVCCCLLLSVAVCCCLLLSTVKSSILPMLPCCHLSRLHCLSHCVRFPGDAAATALAPGELFTELLFEAVRLGRRTAYFYTMHCFTTPQIECLEKWRRGSCGTTRILIVPGLFAFAKFFTFPFSLIGTECYLLDQFNLGRLSGFVGSFSPVDSPRLWFLLVDSSFQVSTSVRVKQDAFYSS